MFKISLKILVLVLAFSVSFSSIGSAQSPNDAAQTIERLNRTIEQVKDLVESFRNDLARQLVIQAEQLRDEAVTALHNGELIKARTKVNLAFSLLKKATELALAIPVRRLQSQLEELLQRADHFVLGSCNQQAERLLQEAKSYRDKALNGISAGQIQEAAEHYRVAMQLAYQAMDIVNRTTDVNRDRIKNERVKFENLSERARELVEKCNGDHARQARQVFQNAITFANEADKALRNCNLNLAKKLYNQSMLLLVRAMNFCPDHLRGDDVSLAKIKLFQLRKKMEDAQERIARSQNRRATRLYERTQKFADEAESALNSENPNSDRLALTKIQLAGKMLERALRLAQPGGQGRFANRIMDEIESTKAEISELRGRLTTDSPADAEVLVRMSEFAIKRAEQAARRDFNKLALEGVLAAQKFLTRAERVLDSKQPSSISGDKIQIRLNQLDEAIGEAEDRVLDSRQDLYRQLLESAKDIRNLSLESFQKGNFRAANEGIQVAFELIRKIMKNTSDN
ncbi:hypothetical protein IH785_00720 [candidate division KSB1 bacterium]|nr:hypothetical protein [candidate division KSB1 bacterium]